MAGGLWWKQKIIAVATASIMNVSRLQELVDIAFFKGQATLLYLQAWQESYITKGQDRQDRDFIRFLRKRATAKNLSKWSLNLTVLSLSCVSSLVIYLFSNPIFFLTFPGLKEQAKKERRKR